MYLYCPGTQKREATKWGFFICHANSEMKYFCELSKLTDMLSLIWSLSLTNINIYILVFLNIILFSLILWIKEMLIYWEYKKVILINTWVKLNFMLTKTVCLWSIKHTLYICCHWPEVNNIHVENKYKKPPFLRFQCWYSFGIIRLSSPVPMLCTLICFSFFWSPEGMYSWFVWCSLVLRRHKTVLKMLLWGRFS